MKAQLASTTAVAALLAATGSVHAKTVVADIVGAYDAEGGGTYSFVKGSYSVWGTNGSASPTLFDTPSLYIVNTGSKSLTGWTLTATGFRG
jgi:hypothetical protein